MALIDRLDRTVDDPNGISHHTWGAIVRLFGEGEVTRAQVVSKLAMSVEDEVQLDKLIAHYTGLDAAGKAQFLRTSPDWGLLWEDGLITRTEYLSKLGMT
jgi:hypothetical protein